jgi:hypothetical protein
MWSPRQPDFQKMLLWMLSMSFRLWALLFRRLLHRRIAEALESQHRDRLESISGQLAWHFTEGFAPQRAARYALQAGQQAASLAAWSEAQLFFEQALSGLSGEAQLPVLTALADAHTHAGHYVGHYAGHYAPSETLRQALQLARSLPAPHPSAPQIQLALARVLIPQARQSSVLLDK